MAMATIQVDMARKNLICHTDKDEMLAKFLYYLLQNILEIDHGIADWEDWQIKFPDTTISIKLLKSMEKWDEK